MPLSALSRTHWRSLALIISRSFSLSRTLSLVLFLLLFLSLTLGHVFSQFYASVNFSCLPCTQPSLFLERRFYDIM